MSHAVLIQRTRRRAVAAALSALDALDLEGPIQRVAEKGEYVGVYWYSVQLPLHRSVFARGDLELFTVVD